MLGVIVLASLSACADLLDIAENPVLVPPDPWMCPKPEAMSPATPGTASMAATAAPDKATVRVRVCNYISTNCSDPVRGVTASLCDKRDVKCASPRQANLKDVDGTLQFEVSTGGALGKGFDGYLLVKAPKESCVTSPAFEGRAEACLFATPDCDPSMPDSASCKANTFIDGALFFNPPVVQDVSEPLVMPLFPTLKGVDLVLAAGARATDPNAGIVLARALDCDGNSASGLTFNVSAGPAPGAVVYQSEGVLTVGAKETDSSGTAGLLGITAGFATVSAYTDSTTMPREIASIGTQILPLTVTYVTLRPSSSMSE